MKNRFSDPPRVMTSRCRDARFAGICWLLIVAVVMTLAVPVVSLVTAPPAQADTSCPDPAGAVLTRTSAAFPRSVALTFDDGPSGSWTPQVLDVLRANGIRATFFLIGENVRQNPALVRRTLAEGHQIGNHTDTHPTLTGLTAEQQAQQMDAAQASIVAADGVQPCYFRAPGGSYNSTTVALARARGMSVVGWSNDTEDWAAPLTVSTAYQAKIVDQAINPVYDHPIVLMHDGSPGNYRQNTVDSLQRVIDSYRSRGYVFTDPMGRNADRGSDPIGHLDVANSPAPGKVRVAGWAFDPSAPTDPVPIHVYINDVGYARSTGASRPDVQAVYPQTSANQGFDLTLPATSGSNRVCVFAINIADGTVNPVLGCVTINVTDPNPTGVVDQVSSPAAGKVRVVGWAFDPSAPTNPAPIHVYINDVGYARSTGAPRPDVKAIYPQTSANQGFDFTLPASGGVNRVGVFAIDVGNDGANVLLSYVTVGVANPNPIGVVDVAYSPAPGQIRVVGWAFDASAPTNPVPIHVYINDVGYARSTGAPRPDVKAVYSQTSANQGFDLTLPATGGVNRVGVFAIDVGNDGANTLLNYREVLVN